MTLSATEIWTRLLDCARHDLPEQTFRTWLEPTEPIGVDNESHTIMVGAPDQFAADWNDSKHSQLLASYAPIALGHPMRVVFKVHEERKKRPQMDFFVAPPPEPSPPPRGSSASDPHQRALGGVGPASAPLNPRYTFDEFVIGKSNDVAAAAAQGAAQAPGKFYNPLFIYGDTGLGKTHLMHAVAHDLLQRNPRLRVMYTGTEQFTNEFIGSLQGRTTHEFRRRYRETDLLLVDDVQFLKGKEGTQEEFFHTFNAIYEAGRQIVLTSDRPPKEIPGLEARLVSRFEWGMVANVDLPDLEHRVAILRKKAQLDHLELTIPDDVIEFIAQHIKSSVRELEGSIIKLLAYASLKHRDITVDVAREALRDKLRASENGLSHGGGFGAANGSADAGLTVLSIQHAVAKEWGVTAEGLRSKTRTKTLTVPRQVAMFLSRELLGVQLVEIGNAFGGRDHSTVIHSLERATECIREDPEFAARVQKLRSAMEKLRD